ncbi:MAG: DUF2065 domain-containing protein [Methylophaga sp.]|nr:MAG: DUF2065 domain-containing protein [Methylophaga sp.]
MTDSLVHSLLLASALMLVIEGLMPFLSPVAFRRSLLQMAGMHDKHIRLIGLFSMVFGLVILYWINN